MFNAFIKRPYKPLTTKSSLSEINTGDPFFAVSKQWDGTVDVTFHVNLIDLLDRVFMEGNYQSLSIEQERVAKKFFKDADKVTQKLQNTAALPTDKYVQEARKDLDEVFKQLDQFLGSYVGENNGQFAG